MDIRAWVPLVVRGTDAPSRIGFGSADLASRPASHGVHFVEKRVFVSSFDMEDVLLQCADDTLNFRE